MADACSVEEPPRSSVAPTPRREWIRRLERALSGEGVRTHFQPIVDLRRGVIAGYEALARFDAPGPHPPAPDEWFRQAEEFGVAAELDAVTLASALSHRNEIPTNCFLTVNVEPDSLLSAEVRNVLAAQGNLTGLVIEITEHRPWHWSSIGPVINRIRRDGARFAVDDAGTGHSGLQKILELRPDFVKLDRSLVDGVAADEVKVALVEMLGMFADRIDAWVLAEGVERSDDLRRLQELEVPLAQGYHLGRPAEPWSSVDVEDLRADAGALRRDSDLRNLVVALPPLRYGDDLGRAMVERSWAAVIDDYCRPLGIVDPAAAHAGELLPALVVNVGTAPADVVRRLVTSPTEPGPPVVVTDELGHYAGLIPLRRLLVALTQ